MRINEVAYLCDLIRYAPVKKDLNRLKTAEE